MSFTAFSNVGNLRAQELFLEGRRVTPFNYRGAWDGATQYYAGDAVSADTATYIAEIDNLDVSPPHNGTWAVLSNESTTLSNVGASGTSLVGGLSGSSYGVSKLLAGTNISLSGGAGATAVTIAGPTLSNEGSGAVHLVDTQSGLNYPIKTLSAGTNISLGDSGGVVTVTNTQAQTTLSNEGSGAVHLVDTQSGSNYPIKSLAAGTNVTLTDSGGTVTVAGPSVQNSTGTTGLNLVAQSGSAYTISKLKAGTNVTLTQSAGDGSETTVNCTQTQTTVSNSTATGGAKKLVTGSAGAYTIGTVQSGSNIQLSNSGDGTELTITGATYTNGSAPGSGVPSKQLVGTSLANSAYFLSRTCQGAGITLTQDGPDLAGYAITVSNNMTLANTDSGSHAGAVSLVGTLVSQTSPNTYQYPVSKLAPGTNTTFSQSAAGDCVVINNALTVQNDGAGAGSGLVEGLSGSTYNLKTIAAGTGISLTAGAHDLTLATNLTGAGSVAVSGATITGATLTNNGSGTGLVGALSANNYNLSTLYTGGTPGLGSTSAGIQISGSAGGTLTLYRSCPAVEPAVFKASDTDFGTVGYAGPYQVTMSGAPTTGGSFVADHVYYRFVSAGGGTATTAPTIIVGNSSGGSNIGGSTGFTPNFTSGSTAGYWASQNLANTGGTRPGLGMADSIWFSVLGGSAGNYNNYKLWLVVTGFWLPF